MPTSPQFAMGVSQARFNPNAFAVNPSAFAVNPSAFAVNPSAFALNPAFAFNPNIFQIGPDTIAVPPQAPEASAPVGVPANVSIALASVPIAQDGEVIDAEYHNSLRRALMSIAAYVGTGVLEETLVMTFAPAFLPIPTANGAGSWIVRPAAAQSVGGARGWLPIALPDGARLDTLAVNYSQDDTEAGLTVDLHRTAIDDDSDVRLFHLVAKGDGDEILLDTAKPSVPGAGPVALDEYRRVDNSAYRYYIEASENGPEAAGFDVRIFALQVYYTR